MKKLHEKLKSAFLETMSEILDNQRQIVSSIISGLIDAGVVTVKDGFDPYCIELSITFNDSEKSASLARSSSYPYHIIYTVGLADVDEDSRKILEAAIVVAIKRDFEEDEQRMIDFRFDDWD